ncbi:MAG TPA: sugar phosphate isomerase/epimerase family protein [Terriglobales bacterium]|nr:sugar phosphate isomerase/epimerase family protein [Terriglobales bacterium]
MRLPTRRTFLQQFAALATVGLAANRIKNPFATAVAEPHLSFPTEPRDRIAVASYPFRAYIESPTNPDRDRSLPGMELTEFVSQIGAKFNVHNIEPHYRHFRSLTPAALASFRETLSQAKVKVVNIAVGGEASFYDADPSAREKALAFAKKWVDVAVAVGSPSIRVHIHQAANSAPQVERTADSLRQLTEYAGGNNVVVNLENDDLVSEDAFFLVKVIEAVHSPFLHALPDFANSMLSGDADFNYRAVAAMFRHAYGICHVKSGEVDDQGRQFNIDLKKSFDILQASGYRGYCSMEFDAPGEPYGPTAQLVEQSIRYLS